mmetsp:Transcript_119390/g.315637  ORF Transcript_119390/g.315637 Transcript_119390/m.315637 type:complete len:222 (-) Transcript_119390:148-813(-)
MRGRSSSSPSISRISRWPASGPSLLTSASTMQPVVTEVGVMPCERISAHVLRTPSKSPTYPRARMMLPYVWAPRTRAPPSPPRRSRSLCTRSARPARTAASQAEKSSTSSIWSPMLPVKPPIWSPMRFSTAMVRSTSAAQDEDWMFLRRIEHVTWLGCRPHASISSIAIQSSSSRPLLRLASMSSLKVTTFGGSPAARIASMVARAGCTFPPLRYALMTVP